MICEWVPAEVTKFVNIYSENIDNYYVNYCNLFLVIECNGNECKFSTHIENISGVEICPNNNAVVHLKNSGEVRVYWDTPKLEISLNSFHK